MKKILFFLSAFPFPIDDGIKKIVDNIIRESLREGHKISLVVPEDENSLEYQDEVKVFYYSKSRTFFSVIKDLIKLQPLYFSLYYDEEIDKKFNKKDYDLIFYDFYPMTQYASGLKSELFMMPDSMKHLALGTSRSSKSTLQKVYHYFNHLLCSFYNKKIEKLKKLYVSNYDIEIDKIKNSHLLKIPADERDFSRYWQIPKRKTEISFRGVMSFEPNITAVKSFYDEVYLDLMKEFPKTNFRVIGKDPDISLKDLKNSTELTGFVDDPFLEMSRSFIHVVPMISGSGVKTKLLDSMALKRIVFATPKAINGVFESIEEARENGIVVYENKLEFIQNYRDLLEGKLDYEAMTEKAYLYIRQNSYKKLLKRLFEIGEY